MISLKKYKQNLCIEWLPSGQYVKSYSTYVAKIEEGYLKQLGWWSVTTQKHINYVAKELNLKLVKNY